ncbi:hypothetical protein DFH08DRAFT_814397 [Mycena albidolilacea]|uniref:Uncharacterized protein n=1 Tax=Mycena albidolilacea TaxID=1033008 RepID=A0AAD6ZP70_9AGAR|nr:hypothetical protein DFH08DRAFT_814397 [Mycena albidolilacea]
MFQLLEVLGNLGNELCLLFKGLVDDLLELEVTSFVLHGLQSCGGFLRLWRRCHGGWDGTGNVRRELSMPLMWWERKRDRQVNGKVLSVNKHHLNSSGAGTVRYTSNARAPDEPSLLLIPVPAPVLPDQDKSWYVNVQDVISHDSRRQLYKDRISACKTLIYWAPTFEDAIQYLSCC